jgi:hypothetical protein
VCTLKQVRDEVLRAAARRVAVAALEAQHSVVLRRARLGAPAAAATARASRVAAARAARTPPAEPRRRRRRHRLRAQPWRAACVERRQRCAAAENLVSSGGSRHD